MLIAVWVFLKQISSKTTTKQLKSLALWLGFTDDVFIVWAGPESRFNHSIKFHHKLNFIKNLYM